VLTTILREEWGFDGLVMSDWGAVDERVPALEAGLDLEMPSSGGVRDAEIVAAVEAGTLDPAVLDTAVDRLLTLARRTAAAREDPRPYDPAAHHRLAREAAAAGCVLLANDGTLPLAPSAGDRIAVIGEFARTPRYQGAGSSLVTPTRLDAALDALRSAVPDGVTVTFAPGFGLAEREDPAADGPLRAGAVEAARTHDVVLLFLGLPAWAETERVDRTHLDLPPAQLRLVEEVCAANPRTVVVLQNGSVVATAGWSGRAAAVVEAWLGGQAGGAGVVDVLLGAVNPSGRLAETVPLRLEDCPAHLGWPGEEGHVRYGEGVFVGDRHYDTVGRAVAFPFGHGLSYTTFGYADLDVRMHGGGLRVAVRVTNTGTRRGREVVQVYAHRGRSRVARPRRELVGFTDVVLDPGASATAVVDVDGDDLAFWAARTRRWTVEGGPVEVLVGASSRDLRASARVELPGDEERPALTDGASLEEWFADPRGGPLLRGAIDELSGGPLTDPEMVRLLGSMPLRKVPLMGLGLDRDAVDRLLAGL